MPTETPTARSMRPVREVLKGSHILTTIPVRTITYTYCIEKTVHANAVVLVSMDLDPEELLKLHAKDSAARKVDLSEDRNPEFWRRIQESVEIVSDTTTWVTRFSKYID